MRWVVRDRVLIGVVIKLYLREKKKELEELRRQVKAKKAAIAAAEEKVGGEGD